MGTAVGLVDVLTYDYRPSACHDLDVMAIDRLRRQSEVCPELLRNYMSRPGLDPGTLGLKEGCGWSERSGEVGIIRESKKICPVESDSFGGVGFVCGTKRGIFERAA